MQSTNDVALTAAELERTLLQLVRSTPQFIDTLQACLDVGLPNFYLAGGAITQIIWNHTLGRELTDGIKDLDIVYYELGATRNENSYEMLLSQRLNHDIELDIKNQARVHTWYREKFGCAIPAYERVEQGIDSWLSAFAIGVSLDKSGELKIYAPYGLADAFNMLVRPNKVAMSEQNYRKMTLSYSRRWPQIQVLPW